MKISEMTLEQLQDYAVQIEEEKKALQGENENLKTQLTESNDLNKQLQKRNNDLFMKVEQGLSEEPEKTEEPTETCEEFAKNLVLGGKI